MNEPLDLRNYWRFLRKWWWLLSLAVVVGALLGYLVSSSRTPIYESASKVLVQRGVSPGLPSLSDIQASQQLANSYGELIKTRPILERVVETLSLPYSASGLSGKFTVTSAGSLIVIRVTDVDPEMAATLANTIAQSFIDDFIDQQFLLIARFQASLAQYGITQDPELVAAQAATMSTLRMAELAIPPTSPLSRQLVTNVLLAAMTGLFLGGLVIFFLEYLDDSVKSPEELQALTGMSTLSSVLYNRIQEGLPTVATDGQHGTTELIESYNFLRTNLKFATLDMSEGLSALLVTSARPSEGKTTVAANLAISTAREGKTVILVDTDLRKPGLHHVFDDDRQIGFTNLIIGNSTLEDVMVSTSVDGLRVVFSGPLPPDATQVLSSANMKVVVEQMKRTADLVIFDSPPLLAVTDPMLIVSHVDGVLLVVDARQVSRDTMRRGVQNLRQGNAVLVGVC